MTMQSVDPTFYQGIKEGHVRRIPAPIDNEPPTFYAERLGCWYDSLVTVQHRKKYGQYLTPVEIANFMASLLPYKGKNVRILDPGAGTGILSCAACEHLVKRKRKPSKIVLDVYEIDQQICEILHKVLVYLKSFASMYGVWLTFSIHQEDFIMKHAHLLKEQSSLLSSLKKGGGFDMVIMNPPYFKVPKSDPRAREAAPIVCGQTNAYALFMAISSSLLSDGGYLVSITPRSFASGPYFRSFREFFFTDMKPVFIHVFNSRGEAFKQHGVLQENIILKAQKRKKWSVGSQKSFVVISSSNGIADLPMSRIRRFPLPLVMSMKSREKTLKVPASSREERAIRVVESWTRLLGDYGLEVSTGPVVPFRAVQHLLDAPDPLSPCVPLLWMQNVRPMRVVWPLREFGKPQYIRLSVEAMPLLVADKTYVVIRRFSAKEDRKRLVAAPMLEGQVGKGAFVGLENHLNYIHRPNGALSVEEAWGLAAFYNSDIVDTYFRALSGSTQVNASDLRAMPIPTMHVIKEVGRKAMNLIRQNSSKDEVLSILQEVDQFLRRMSDEKNG